MKYAKILFLAFAAMLMACGGDPGSTGNNTSGYTTTDSNTHTAQWVTIDINIATGGVNADDAKVFVKRSYDDAPVLHGTVADLDKDPVKVDVADQEQLWVQISLTKPGFKMGEPQYGTLYEEGIATLRTSGEKSITMYFPLAVDLTVSEWSCTTTKYLNGQPNGTETYNGTLDMGQIGTETDPIYSTCLGECTKGFGFLGYKIINGDGWNTKGSIASDVKSLDYDEMDGDVVWTKNRCTR